MTNSTMTEAEAQVLARQWIYQVASQVHQFDPERGAAKAVRDLRRLLGHKPSKAARAYRWRWGDVYDLMWPVLVETPTYAARIRRTIAAAERRAVAREMGRAVA
ncbi:hypothetical protein [Azospirillum sp.]|uniref:hypothetical protein n=1 Tax=Azospirillum sp. TaxID=34012 RepID=UPI003D72AE70